jgi:hypothetical protein
MMEEQWIIDRAQLRQLLHQHPQWSTRQYAQAVGRSRKWVQKWKPRLQGTALDDQTVLHSQSRARKTPPEPYHPAVIARILELRDQPPAEVPRKLGAPTILYYLQQDESLRAAGYRLPRSTSTIWKILDANQRILRPIKIAPQPFERPPVMDTWEIDFTDVSTARASHTDKQQHQVEAFAVVDRGSSILVDLQSADNYQARTAVIAIASTLIQHGLPCRIVFDRDPRFVTSWSTDGFPSAFMRFLLCLGIAIEVCPPQRADLKPFVERYFRTLNEECVQVQQPETVVETREVFAEHHYTYNHLRPNQAKVCGNRPPYAAFPQLPRLPTIPETVDPDRWLLNYHQRLFKRRVTQAGSVQVGKHRYYIGRGWTGRYVVLKLDAQRKMFEILLGGQLIKTVSIKGLHNEPMEFGTYLEMMVQEAEAEWRRLQRIQRLRVA